VKPFRSSFLLAVLAVAATLSTPVHAGGADTTSINFSGQVIAGGTCAFDSKTMSVTLPSVSIAALSGAAGTYSTDLIKVYVPMTCPGGIANVGLSSIYLTSTNVDAAFNTLKNTASDGAQNVGLSIAGQRFGHPEDHFDWFIDLREQNAGNPLIPRSNPSAGILAVEFLDEDGIKIAIGFGVRYIATSATITAGPVTSSIDLTMTYN
jgi:type 1 fimbria pilin